MDSSSILSIMGWGYFNDDSHRRSSYRPSTTAAPSDALSKDELKWIRAQYKRCRPFIQAALDQDIGTHDAEDVRKMLESGKAQLWPTANAAMVTIVETYPKAKVLRGWLSGGDLTEIQQSEPVIRKWAEEQGCDLVLIGGRRGWLRAFDGYREACTVMYRKLK